MIIEPLAANWTLGSTYTHVAENAVESTVNQLIATVNTTQAIVPAPTGVEATDTNNIQAAIDAIIAQPIVTIDGTVISSGAGTGDVILQSGVYALIPTGITAQAGIRILGTGSIPYSGTVLMCSSPTATAITISGNITNLTGTGSSAASPAFAGGFTLENMTLYNNVGSAPTSGYALQITGGADTNHEMVPFIRRCYIQNFYDGIVFENNNIFGTITNCSFYNNAHYGIVIQSPILPDEGENFIFGNIIAGGPFCITGGCILWNSGGGFRVSNNKLLPNAYGINCDMTGSGPTGDIYIQNNSLETFNFPTVTGTGIYLGTTGQAVKSVLVENNQFLGMTTAIEWGYNMVAGIISGNNMRSCTTGIVLDSGSNPVLVGPNIFSSCGSSIVNNGSGSNVIMTQLSI